MGSIDSSMRIMDLVRNRKWDMLIVIALVVISSGLTTILAFTVPAALETVVKKAIAEEMSLYRLEMNKNIDTLTKSIASLQKDFNENNARNLDQLEEKGIAACKKFRGLSGNALINALNANTQNAVNIKLAMQVPSIYDRLFRIDRNLILELKEYFDITTE